MPGVISVEQRSGQDYGATEVAKSEFYFLSIDSNVESYEDYPVQILESGLNYSFEVFLRFRVDEAPNSKCSNFKIWTTGSLSTGLDITINSDAVIVYAEPTDGESSQGTRVSLLNYTEENKLDIGGELVNIGDKSNFMVFQLEIDDTADLNIAGYEELEIFYQYDEV
jgi:hypothetical protein